jgi:hypothetical protein
LLPIKSLPIIYQKDGKKLLTSELAKIEAVSVAGNRNIGASDYRKIQESFDQRQKARSRGKPGSSRLTTLFAFSVGLRELVQRPAAVGDLSYKY